MNATDNVAAFPKFIDTCIELRADIENLSPTVSHRLYQWINSLLFMNNYIRTESEFKMFNEQLLQFHEIINNMILMEQELLVLKKNVSKNSIPLKSKTNNV